MTWHTKKCKVFPPTNQPLSRCPKLADSLNENFTEALYLGLSTTADGTTENRNVRRIKSALRLSHAVKKGRVHSDAVSSATSTKVREMRSLSRAAYRKHLLPKTAALLKYWYYLERATVYTTLGCFSGRIRVRLRTICRIMTLQESHARNISALQKRVLQRTSSREEAGKA